MDYDWSCKIEYDSPMSEIKGIGEGVFHCGFAGGWISINKENSGYDIFWTSEKDTHTRVFGGTAKSAVFYEGQLGSCFESAHSMWPKRSDKERYEVADWLKNKVVNAHKVETTPHVKIMTEPFIAKDHISDTILFLIIVGLSIFAALSN